MIASSSDHLTYFISELNWGDLEKRMFSHLNSKRLVGNALQKYDDWNIEILHTTKDRDIANLLEIEEIRHYNCIAPNGYNLTAGGDGLFDPSEEVRYKIGSGNRGKKRPEHSEIMMGNKNGLGNRGNSGKNLSEETKKKIGSSLKGYKHSKETKIKDSEAKKGNKNPMKDSKNVLKMQITTLRNKIAKLEGGD